MIIEKIIREFRDRIRLEELYTCNYRLNKYIEEIDKIIKKVYGRILSAKCSRFCESYTWKLSKTASVYVTSNENYKIIFFFKKDKKKFSIEYKMPLIDFFDIDTILKEIRSYENIEKC